MSTWLSYIGMIQLATSWASYTRLILLYLPFRCDAHCDVREKSLYDSSKDVIIQQFGGSIVEFEACHEDSIDYDAYVHVIKSKQKMNYLIPFLHKE